MAREHHLVYALNAGGVDPEALSRVDLEKMRLAGEHPVTNLLSKVLGPMAPRPGLEHLGVVTGNAQTRMLAFLRSVGTSYLLCLSAGAMRVMSGGAIVQVPSVATAIATGSWTDVSTSPATAVGGATLSFSGTAMSSAKLRQAVSVASGDQAKVNILRVDVLAGPVFLRVGTTAGGEECLADARLDTGQHKIGVVPGAGTIYIDLRSDDAVLRNVSQIQFESTLIGGTGDLVLTTPWASISAVQKLRCWQSIDSLFVGDGSMQPRVIEHRGAQSWSVVKYKSESGPWVSGSSRISMLPAALVGNFTVTASEAYFKPAHVGALIELTQTGLTVASALNGVGQTSDHITVVGVGASRGFRRIGSGASFVGTVVLERSYQTENPTIWTTTQTFVDGAATFPTTTVVDGEDNVVVHYRWRCTAYTSGSATMTLVFDGGVKTGVARITGYSSPTVVSVETIKVFGSTTDATRQWRIGAWSDASGWPRSPVIHDGRLHWFRGDLDYAGVVDDYYDFDDTTEGDSGSFTRSVGGGGQDGVLWATSVERLIVGTPWLEATIQASSQDEPLTPTQYTVRKRSRNGSADIEPAEYGGGVFFAHRSGRKLFDWTTSNDQALPIDVSRLNPAAYRAGIVRLVTQQQPSTRLFAVMADGTASVLTHDREDKVAAVTQITTGGVIEDLCVLPEADQDDVYLIVSRAGTRRYERLAKEHEQQAAGTCRLLDAHKVLSGSVASISGGVHLANQIVQVYADGRRRPDVTLDGAGAASLGATYARVVYGLGYICTFRSAKLAYAAKLGTALGQTKTIRGAGIVLSTSCMDGIRIGRDAASLEPMPRVIDGLPRSPGQVFPHYDGDLFPINANWDADARFVLSIDSAEGPVTVQAVVLDIETRDGAQSGQG